MEVIDRLLVIAGIGLAVAALIFLLLAIFCDGAPEWSLPTALFCCVLSNLFNLIRSLTSKNR